MMAKYKRELCQNKTHFVALIKVSLWTHLHWCKFGFTFALLLSPPWRSRTIRTLDPHDTVWWKELISFILQMLTKFTVKKNNSLSLYLMASSESFWPQKGGGGKTVCWQTSSSQQQIVLGEAQNLLSHAVIVTLKANFWLKANSFQGGEYFEITADSLVTLSRSNSPWNVQSTNQFAPQKLKWRETNNAATMVTVW